MVFTGKIFDIHELDDQKQAQIVIRKKMGDKIVPVAITVYGFWYERVKEMKLKAGDKIKANLYLKSKYWTKGNKYFTDVYFKEISVVEYSDPFQERKQEQEEEPQDGFFKVDKNTGEIID